MKDKLDIEIPANHVDVGPYFIWQESDGCIVRVILHDSQLNIDFKEMGFDPALESLPYTYENNVLKVTAILELFGWSVAVPIPDRRLIQQALR